MYVVANHVTASYISRCFRKSRDEITTEVVKITRSAPTRCHQVLCAHSLSPGLFKGARRSINIYIDEFDTFLILSTPSTAASTSTASPHRLEINCEERRKIEVHQLSELIGIFPLLLSLRFFLSSNKLFVARAPYNFHFIKVRKNFNASCFPLPPRTRLCIVWFGFAWRSSGEEGQSHHPHFLHNARARSSSVFHLFCH